MQSALIYAAGDTVAALLTNSSSYQRMLGITFVAATVYTIEIPNYFRWINTRTESMGRGHAGARRTLFAMMYFNPLWIARHLAFVQLFSGNPVSLNLIGIGFKSFVYNLPAGLLVNYLIQTKLPLKHRFIASSFFSAAMAVYYALSEVWFR